MKQIFKFISVSVLLLALWHCGKSHEGTPAYEGDLPDVRRHILATDSIFSVQATQLLHSAEDPNTQRSRLIREFDALRETYKKMEWAVEYFLPESARYINGPALPEIEMEEHTVLEPQGLQVLEEQIYAENAADRPEIIRQLKLLIGKAGTVKANFEAISISRPQVFDALRQEVFRISSLGIAGFDTPISAKSLQELPVALSAVSTGFLQIAGDKKNASAISSETARAIKFIKDEPKDRIDYAEFLSRNMNALATAVHSFGIKEKIPAVAVSSALRKTARTLYDKDAFDPDAFVPGPQFRLTAAKIGLGRQLFYDPILSENSARSCATCHNPEKAFTDGLPQSMSLKDNPLQRNTPSLSYSAFQHGQFWDMRSEDLEGQSRDVITNKDEMHGDLEDILKKIEADAKYRQQFRSVFKTVKIEKWQLQNALASYIRSLPKFSSRFDEYMRGSRSALSAEEKEGLNLFIGKAKCATCHFLPLLNGTVPPAYTKTEQEVLGTATDGSNRRMDTDPGRGRFHETVASLQHSFKTPTLRNIAKTAPYMHNGGYKTLPEVMEFYNRGGGTAFGFKIDNQTLPADDLKLTENEVNKIIMFLNSLDDR